MEPNWQVTFAELASALAVMHEIVDEKRTAFNSRLKNFHRLKFPIGLETSKGKTATYSVGHVVEMALAVEMTQLGLPPERVVRVLTLNWYPAAMAFSMAARALMERPEGFHDTEVKENDPLSMFLFFDPAALSTLMIDFDPAIVPDLDQTSDTFFFGGEGIVTENIVKWTSGYLSRISLINVTSLLDRLIGTPDEQSAEKNIEARRAFFSGVADWAVDRSENGFGFGTDPVAEEFLYRFVSSNYAAPKNADELAHMANLLENYFGLSPELIMRVLRDFAAERGNKNVHT
jgi:hypothetical protein